MLTHLVIVFIALCLDNMLRTNCFSALDWPFRGYPWLTLFILFRSRRFSQAQLFVWSSRPSRQRKKIFWTLRRCFKDAGDKIPSLATHPRTHIETHTHNHIYIYIYIYIYMNAHYHVTLIKPSNSQHFLFFKKNKLFT